MLITTELVVMMIVIVMPVVNGDVGEMVMLAKWLLEKFIRSKKYKRRQRRRKREI